MLFPMLFVLSFSLFPPLLGFNHFLKCSSSFIHAGPWEIDLYDLINDVSGALQATEEKRNINCISYAGSMCLNATCRVDSRHAYLAYHHCVFNGEYDFCERFNAQCQSLNGEGGCNLCGSHHCNKAPEEAEKGDGEEKKHKARVWEKREVSCISNTPSICLNATCRLDIRRAYIVYHRCVFKGEYDFCANFNALCESLDGHGGCDFCNSHHSNTAPEEAEEGEGEEKHKGAGGEEKRGTAAHHSHDEMPTEKAQKMANESAPPLPPPVNPSDVKQIVVGPSKSGSGKTDALSRQQQGNFGGGGNAFWDFVLFFGVFAACVMLAVFGYKELWKRGFVSVDGERRENQENLI
ncbi:hypothetical protein niasHT_000367 [Heterodera trifolii]|uniref:Uncharacterized protein n=1 Tax=Heterodera trifolii TaxID=157864 RepID=A0ABD2MEG2_9BILA